MLPAALCYPDIDGGPRSIHPLLRPSLSVDYVLITGAARTLSPAAAAFADVLGRHIRRIGAEWDRRLRASHQGI